MSSDTNHNLDERFEFKASVRKDVMIILGIGITLFVIGLVIAMTSGGSHGEESHTMASLEPMLAESGGEHGGGASWLKRLKVSLWHNHVFFTGIGLVGVVFFAIQMAASAGWSAGFRRIALNFGFWLPIAGISAIVLYIFAGHDIFHWTHTDLYNAESPLFDEIINGKKEFFYWPAGDNPGFPIFWFARLVVFFVVWYLLFLQLKKWSFKEDEIGGSQPFFKMRSTSAIFLVIFAVTSSIAAWDWIMSIDTHWFSTMFGWYAFASWWVASLAFITLIVVWLKDLGYLSIVNENHLHDLGKFIFGFSIFWTYIWFSQFLLIYYANIPEESIYFIERMTTGYAGLFYTNIIVNFVMPFLFLMTRDSKRHRIFLKLICIIVIFGHWLDFYLMVTPGTLNFDGGLGLLEIGLGLTFMGLFLMVLFNNLAKKPLIAKNDPFLEESLHHHI